MNDATVELPRVVEEQRWSGRLICWLVVLTLANRMADTAITTPLMVLPQMLEHFETDQAAWLNSSALLAGAIWSPLLAKSADIFGKRRVLLATIVVSGVGSVVCLVAPNLGIFLVGRLLQGAAMAVVFLTVALTRQISAPRVAMTAIGIVTSASAVVGIVEPFLMAPLIDRFGYQSVFVVSVALAVAAALCVRLFVPESPIRTSGRVDVTGALLLGGGLAAVLGYISLGQDLGWLSGGMIALVAAGVAALAGWVVLALRIEEPIVDIRALSRPLVLALLAVVLAAGSFQSVLQLTGLIAHVSPQLGLGYGLRDTGPVALLFAAPAPGIVLGGTLAGWLATRIGPARTLLGGIAIGTVATFTMLAGVSSFPLAIASVGLLGTAAGAIGTSGFNLATALAPPERHGVVSGLVSVMLSVGGVIVTVASTAVLNATATVVDGAPQNTATGVYLYVLISAVLFALSTVTATVLARTAPPARDRRAPTPPAAGGGVTKPVQRLAVGIGGSLLVGMAILLGTQIATARDGAALLGSRQVDVRPDQERVQVGALFGTVDVVVPDGVHVRLAGRVAFGGTECERACNEPGREIEVTVVGAFAIVDVKRPGEVLADEREEAREDAEDAAEDARERAEEAREGGRGPR